MRLPWLMEEVLDYWDRTKARPQFKAEYIITHNIKSSLEAAARAAATRLAMSSEETEALIAVREVGRSDRTVGLPAAEADQNQGRKPPPPCDRDEEA